MTAWQALGVCLDHDPEVFFPDRTADAEPAKELCRTCPVQTDCLTHALTSEHYGVWGATSETERAQMRAARNLPAPEQPDTFRAHLLALRADGLSSRDIARRLDTKQNIVEKHIERAQAKMRVTA